MVHWRACMLYVARGDSQAFHAAVDVDRVVVAAGDNVLSVWGKRYRVD